MTAPPPRIRLVIDTVRVTGLGLLDARRLVDRLERELAQLAPDIARAALEQRLPSLRVRADGGAIKAGPRVEAAAAPLARAVLKAIGP